MNPKTCISSTFEQSEGRIYCIHPYNHPGRHSDGVLSWELNPPESPAAATLILTAAHMKRATEAGFVPGNDNPTTWLLGRAERAQDFEDGYKKTISGKCAGDEHHCVCVADLRRRIAELEAQLSAPLYITDGDRPMRVVEPQTVEILGQPASRDYAEGEEITVLIPSLKPGARLGGGLVFVGCQHKRTASNAFGRICADCFKTV
jgi:hypothetical protein